MSWTPIGAAVAFVAGLLTLGEVAQAVGMLILLVGFLAAGRSKQKDATIDTWKGNSEAQKVRADALQEQLVGAAERANREASALREAEKEVAALEREVKTMQRYTAQGALEQVAERIGAMESGVTTAISSQSDLTLETHRLLEALRVTIAALTVKLGPSA